MDNSGKSTLCKKLSVEFGIPMDSLKTRLKTKDECIQYQLNAMFCPELKVYDRMRVISEMVYGEILRKNLFADDGWYYIQCLLRCRPLIIYCRPTDYRIFDFGERDQMDGVVKKAPELLERYDYIMRAIDLLANKRIIYYNWENFNSVMTRVSEYSTAFVSESLAFSKLQEKENETRSG